MALIKCPDCGNEMSDQAPACPKCGRPKQVAAIGVSAPAVAQAGNDWSVNSIVSGVIQLGIAAWLQFSFLPAHDAEKVGVLQAVGRGLQGKDTWVLAPGAHLFLQVIAIALALNGVLRMTVYAKKKTKVARGKA
jgi:hypothetical protein